MRKTLPQTFRKTLPQTFRKTIPKRDYDVYKPWGIGIADKLGPASAQASKNLSEAQYRSKKLYRDCLRQIPHVINIYQLPFSCESIRSKLRYEWHLRKNITDPAILDQIVFKTYTDLDETQRLYKTKSHMIQTLTPPPITRLKKPHEYYRQFVEDFLTKDDNPYDEWKWPGEDELEYEGLEKGEKVPPWW